MSPTAAEAAPSIRFLPRQQRRFSPAQVRNQLLGVERWLQREWARLWEQMASDLIRELGRGGSAIPNLRYLDRWPDLVDLAMAWFLAIGWVGAQEELEARHRGHAPFVGPWGRAFLAPLREPRFPDEMAVTFGIPTEAIQGYRSTRLPPIVGATEEIRLRVRDTVADAIGRGGEGWEPERLRGELSGVGGWAEARVRNQVRTESATLFNEGRTRAYAADDMVIGYQYEVTLDDRTTELCSSVAGVRVRVSDLAWVPPGHYQCRTVLLPLFPWDEPSWTDFAGYSLPWEYEGFEEFGNVDLARTLAQGARGLPRASFFCAGGRTPVAVET